MQFSKNIHIFLIVIFLFTVFLNGTMAGTKKEMDKIIEKLAKILKQQYEMAFIAFLKKV